MCIFFLNHLQISTVHCHSSNLLRRDTALWDDRLYQEPPRTHVSFDSQVFFSTKLLIDFVSSSPHPTFLTHRNLSAAFWDMVLLFVVILYSCWSWEKCLWCQEIASCWFLQLLYVTQQLSSHKVLFYGILWWSQELPFHWHYRSHEDVQLTLCTQS